MAEWLDKTIEEGIPEVVENRLGRRLLYAVFWVATAILAFWFLSTGVVYGAFVIGAPLLLLLTTRLWGLASVPRTMLVISGLAALVPTFFLGKYKAAEDGHTGLILVGFLVFLVWGAAYPAVLDKLDERFHLSLYPEELRPRKLEPEERHELAMLRVLLVKLTMATLAMLVADASIVAALCVAALLLRTHWSAVLAGLACLLETVVEINGLSLVVTFDPVAIGAGLLAAAQWWDAVKNPLWDRRAELEGGW
ncbi:hypothetical protein [Amycolatopsis orientalis]|uniref:hypothetical protein n=1 Tax=Amycolatopsis orientalis TaxID=31958 RepID=UPI0003FD0801|nr:hypothetical protein [Amycolatopsis orientalis]